VKRISLIAGCFLPLIITYGAHGETLANGNIFVGYSYLNTDFTSGGRTSLNGWDASVEKKVFPFLAIVGDFSGQYGSLNRFTCPIPAGNLPGSCTNTNNVNEHNFLFGPRAYVAVGRGRLFANALFGASHVGGSGLSTSDSSFGEAIGGGLDYRVVSRLSWRIQVDFLQTRFFHATQNNVRVSTGFAIRF